jgi:DNA repair protein RadD
MNFELRPYQQESVNKGLDFFNSKSTKNAIIVAPTGSGKSLIIANIAKGLNERTIIFQPSKELLEQNLAKYLSYGEQAEVYSASAGRKKISTVTFATIGSVVNKPELFKEFKYCIVDECDLVSPESGSMYKTFFDNCKLKVLGLTATPIRMKRYNFPVPHAKICMLDRMRPRFFTEYLHVTQISEMKENNWFANIDYLNFDFDESRLKINSTGGDYTERSIEQTLLDNSTIQKIKNLYSNIIKKDVIKHILIFVESIKTANEVQNLIGYDSCGMVTGQTPKKERSRILKQFKDGKLRAVVNVGVLTVGFDFPALDCIIGARPTMSLRLYYQIIGRGVRPHPEKNKLYVFDFVGNYKRFGKVEDLVIEQIKGLWCIHNCVNILTNVDISGEENNEIKKEPIIVFEKPVEVKVTESKNIMPYGKYKDIPLTEIPASYLKWCYENFTRDKKNEIVFKFVENNLLISK